MKYDQASHTARFVSNGIYWVSQQRRLGIEVPERLSEYTTEVTRRLELEGSTFGSGFARRLLLLKSGIMQSFSIPGIYLYQVLRKRYIESLARASLQAKTKQMVVIGGGFDTLSVRLSIDFPDHQVIEIDHPATQKVKKTILEEFDLPTGRCHFLSADLAEESLASALSRCAEYDAGQSTLFIAEGITMYLDEARIRELLHCIENQAEGSEFVFTYMEESKPGCFDFQNARLAASIWLALRSERFTWGIRREELPRFLSESNFRLCEHRTPEELRVELLTEGNRHAKLAYGENTVLTAL